MSEPVCWVVGRGGLLGRSVDSLMAPKGATWHPLEPFEWDEPAVLASQLQSACLAFFDAVGDAPWQVAWCAGAGVVSSEEWRLERETQALQCFLSAIADFLGDRRASSGALFLASSAGGVYAGAEGAPHSESSPVRPLSAYGENKLVQEALVRSFSSETGTPSLIGRLSNLYGPDQDLSKNQGLITQVCARMIARQPVVLYVPLDTIRDYLFVKDAAALVAGGLGRLRSPRSARTGTPVVVKILASGQPTTVAALLGQIRRVTKRPARIVLARSPSARPQSLDLRMTSTVWPELDRRPTTTLGEGIHSVVADLIRRAGRGPLLAARSSI